MITTPEHQATVMQQLDNSRLPAWQIGAIQQSQTKNPYVEYA